LKPGVALWALFVTMAAATVAAAQTTPVAPTVPAGAARPPAVMPAPEPLELETSDGVGVTAWLYRAPDDEPGRSPGGTAKPGGNAPSRPPVRTTVILLHDLGGSHETVAPLAIGLQRGGCHVIAPDLRGHGESTKRLDASGRGDTLEAKLLKRGDLEAMAASAGGTVRDQATARGDIESIRDHLRGRGEPGGPSLDRLVVAGVGAGATVAAMWTAADASWPPLATGPQGRQVRALVLISPAWTPRGLPILPALGQEAVKRDLPILVVAGRGDRDATRVFDQVKKNRPQEWFEQRAGQKPASAPKLERPADATAVFLQIDSEDSGEKLLGGRKSDPTEMVRGFLGVVLAGERRGTERP
jgi:pimeloyl-ACP methyl ester carboxylesterase